VRGWDFLTHAAKRALSSGDVLLFGCSFVLLYLKCIVVGHCRQWPDWLSSTTVLAAGALLYQSDHWPTMVVAGLTTSAIWAMLTCCWLVQCQLGMQQQFNFNFGLVFIARQHTDVRY